MNDWKRMVMEKGKDRYEVLQVRLGIWKVHIFIIELNDNGKWVFLEIEMEKNKILNFLENERRAICNFMI